MCNALALCTNPRVLAWSSIYRRRTFRISSFGKYLLSRRVSRTIIMARSDRPSGCRWPAIRRVALHLPHQIRLVGEDVGPKLTAPVIRRALPLLACIPSCRRGRYGGNDDEYEHTIFDPMPRFPRHSDKRLILIVVAWRLCQNSLLP